MYNASKTFNEQYNRRSGNAHVNPKTVWLHTEGGYTLVNLDNVTTIRSFVHKDDKRTEFISIRIYFVNGAYIDIGKCRDWNEFSEAWEALCNQLGTPNII